MRPCGCLKEFIKASALLFLASVSGCSWFSETAVVTVEISQDCFPWEPFLPASGYRVVYPAPDNPGEKEILSVPPGETEIELRICKGSAVPVAVYSASGGKPAGGIFPQTLSGGMKLRVSPENGFLAELLLSLLPENERLEALNVVRLMEEIKGKGVGNPWSIDSELLKISLILGSMAEYRIKQMETEEYRIGDMAGNWIPANPFLKGVYSDLSGNLTLTLYPGINDYLNPESGYRLCVTLEGDAVEYILVTEKLLGTKNPGLSAGVFR